MDESAQQFIQISVNVTILVIALSLGITLMMGVRDVADVASEYNASIPTGSRVVDVGETKKRTVNGYEIYSYCANYMTSLNGQRNEKIIINVKPKTGSIITGSLDLDVYGEEKIVDLESVLTNVNFEAEYEIVINNYNSETQYITITLEEI